MSFTDIAYCSHRASALQKFATNLAHTSLANVAGPIASALEQVLDFKPQLEVIRSPNGTMLFREDWQYVQETDGKIYPINPFAVDDMPDGNIFRVGAPYALSSRTHIAHVWQDRMYDFMMNPVMCELVADFLNWSLNVDQIWTHNHREPTQHFLQKYLNLDRLVELELPELKSDLELMYQDAGGEQTRYRLQGADVPRELGMAGYDARAVEAELRIRQEFWDKQQVQCVLRELAVSLERIMTAHFPTMRDLAELSLHPARGYDVYYAIPTHERGVTVLCLGDYRILHWELNQ